MATRKSKSGSKVVAKVGANVRAKRPPNVPLTLTIPVRKPRNPLAMNPLLKKSAAHTDAQVRDRRKRGDALEVRQGVQEMLHRRRAGGSGGGEGGNDSDSGGD